MAGVRSLAVTSVDELDKYGGRKIHYTMDVVMALCWALACGFSSFTPYWYVIWITIVVAQRSARDIRHCREKYGDEWKEYEKLCPYLFIPVLPLSMIQC